MLRAYLGVGTSSVYVIIPNVCTCIQFQLPVPFALSFAYFCRLTRRGRLVVVGTLFVSVVVLICGVDILVVAFRRVFDVSSGRVPVIFTLRVVDVTCARFAIYFSVLAIGDGVAVLTVTILLPSENHGKQ